MIKIETLKNGAKATYLRDGMRKPIFLHQLITHEELATLEVTQGTVVYSIDELEVKEQSAKITQPAPEISSPPAETPAPPARKLTAKEIVAQAKLAASNNGR